MGQGTNRFRNLTNLYQGIYNFEGTQQIKSRILYFFSFIKNNIIYHHHTQKAVHHVRKHHKKYIFGSAIGFLFIKVLLTLLTTVGGGTFAQESSIQYYIGDGIISQYEQCDDSNLQSLDGCDSAGQIESGAMCIGEPSICSMPLETIPELASTGALFQTGIVDTIETIVETGIFEPIQDAIQTGALEQTGAFVFTGDGLPTVFRLSDLDNIDLLNYFYGSGSEFVSNRQNNKCILGDLNIVRVQSGYNTIPNFLAGNTLYLLESGSYDTKYMINIESDCTALIGLESGVVLHTTVTKGANIKISSGSNNIIYNITLNGSVSSTGLIHTGNNYGIFVSSQDNSISQIRSYDTIGFAVYMENFQNNIWDISRFDSLFGGQIDNAINTPIVLPLDFTGDDIQTLFASNGYILSGDIWQGLRPFNLFQNSTFPEKLDIYSIDYQIRVRISSGTHMVNQSGENFTGILLGPKTISISQLQDNFSGQDIISAFKIGSDDFVQSQDSDNNPKDFSVSVLLSDFTGSQDLQLYHSLDGQSWISIESFNISDIASGINLKFLTDTFGQFAIVRNNLVDTGVLDLTGTLVNTGNLATTGNLIQTGNLQLSGILATTGALTQTGIVDQSTGKNIKGSIGDKIDKEIGKGSKQLKDEFTGSISSGDIITGTIISGEQVKLKTMDAAADRRLAFKTKLVARGYHEDVQGKMIGSGSLDMGELSGEINAPVSILSTGSTNIQVELPEGIFIKTVSGINYTGILDIPQAVTGTVNIKFFRPNKYAKIGPNNQSLFFYDGSGTAAYATVKIPTSGLLVGTSVQINYSENGTTRKYLTTTNVTSISGINYAIFQTNHFTTFAVGTITWNNMKFLDDSFRDSNPSTGDIIKALYGSGTTDKTIYNSHWTGNCQPTSVVYVQPYSISGLNSMPTPAANTVYVLNSGSYIFTAARTHGGNCTAIIGKGNVRLYSTGALTAIFTNSTRSYIIYDNLKFHGYQDGLGGVHATKNTNGIRMTSPNSSTYNNIETQQNSSYGIYILTASTRVLFNGIIAHSNASYGFYSAAGNYVDINASSFFNNAVGGFYYIGNSGALNNLQIFNNVGPGLTLRNGNANILTNSQIYNNSTYGLSITRQTNAASNMIIKDVKLFNNGSNGFYTTNSTNNKFYNALSLYGNVTNTLPAGAVTGLNGAFAGASTGYRITNGTTGCHEVTIPKTANGEYYFASSCAVRSNRAAFSGWIDSLNFSTGTLLQSTPYTQNGTVTRYNSSGLFMDSGYHIGEGFWDIRQYLLSKGYIEGVGALYPVSSDTLVGSGYLNFTKTNGKTYKPVVLQSTGTLRAEVALPQYAFVRSGSMTANGTHYSYNGNLNVLTLPTGDAVGLTGVKGVISFGLATGLQITDFSGAALTASISIPLTGLEAGSETFATISRSYNGTSRSYIQTGNIQTITGKDYVTFASNGLSYFAAQVFVAAIPDTTAPVLVPGYIFSGSTGYNGGDNYYKGTIDIRAEVNDDIGLNTGTCMYTVDVSNRYPASYSGTSNTGYCYATGIVGGSDLNIRFSIQNNDGNTGTSEIGTYIYDNTSPTGLSFVINNDDISTTSQDVNLNITCPTDAGISGTQISYGNTTGAYGAWTGCATTKSYRLSAGEGTKTVYMRTQDAFGNISTDYSDTISLSTFVWDNNNFIDENFWNTNPTNTSIIQAVYGTSVNDQTAYNKYWSGNCDPSAISLVTVQNYNTSGVNVIPSTLSVNTIYLLLSGGHLKTDQIKPNTCSAIIGKGDVTLYSPTTPNGRPGSMIYVAGYTGIVIDNIKIDGKNIITGGTHSINPHGIFSQNSVLGITINNTEIMYSASDAGIFFQQMGAAATVTINKLRSYNNTSNGFYLNSAGKGIKSMTIDNSESYNNGAQGMLIEQLGYTTISNSKFYNNKANGIFTRYTSLYNSFNNIASFNNAGAGIYIDYNGYNIISNSSFYNNKNEGVLLANCSNNILNNIRAYNNNIGIRVEQYGTANKYYGTLTFGYNTTSNYGGTNLADAVLSAGTDGLMGRSNGSYTTTPGSMSCDYTINPNNGTGLLSGTCNTKSYITGRADATTGFGMSYVYGQSVPLQIKPVYYLDLSTLTGSSLGFDTGVFITSGFMSYVAAGAPEAIPVFTTGYIYSGTTGYNSPNYYYKGTVDIRADVSDTSSMLSTGTCMYTTGSTRESALYSGTSMTGYCYKTGIVGSSDINIRFSMQNDIDTGTSATGTYIYDATAPTGLSFKINNDATGTNVTGVTLNITCPSDAGVGGIEIAYGTGATPTNRTGCAATKSLILPTGDGVKTVYMATRDLFANTTSDITDTIILDTTVPVLSTGYIFSGTTGYNSPNYYYKGTVDIRSDIIDTGGLNTGTCLYTTGGSRLPALYSGTSNTGYCYKTGVVGSTNLNIRFSIADNFTNTGVSNTGTYLYDIEAPTGLFFTINNDDVSTITGNVTLNITCPSDAGVGGIQIAYGTGATPTNRTGCASTKDFVLTTGDGVKTVYMRTRDIFANTTSDITDTIVLGGNPPELSTGYIFSGTTGYNSPNYYYKGTIDIRSDVIDTFGSLTGTCLYTTGGTRLPALHSGTSTTGYCYKTGVVGGTDLNIRFSIQNALYTGYSHTGTYIYDNFVPTSGSFIINNNASHINTTGVTLNITCPIDTGISNIEMAYGNSPNPSNWTTCTSTTGHNLTVGDGLKTVYVLFRDGLGNTTAEINKTITLDTIMPSIIFTGYTPGNGSTLNSNNFITELELSDNNGINDFDYSYSGSTYNVYDSGLLLMYNFDKLTSLGESGTYVRDFSQYSKNGTVSGGVQWTDSGVWNGAYTFNGTSGYIQTTQPISWQMNSFSVSAWFNTTGSYDGKIISSSVSRHQLQVYNGYLRTCVGACTVGTTPINDGKRHFATVVGDDTSIRVYLDGNITPEITVVAGSSTPIDDIFRIGAVGAGAGSDGAAYFFRGKIDEPRIYNRALSQQEISQLYRSNLSAIDTGKWLYASNYTCVITGGNYSYSGSVSDLASNNSGTTRTNTINLPNPISNISASPVSMGQIQSSLISNQILSGQSDGYFSISDWRGNTGWHTTITLPFSLVSADNINHVISGSQIYFKSNGINTISGISTNDIYVAGNLFDYVNVASATTYIQRDSSDIPFMCPGGVYGNKPWFKVDVPVGQPVGAYSGTITYDIVY